MIMKIINNAYRLIEEKERKINLIHYLEYQLRLFEGKTWEVVETRSTSIRNLLIERMPFIRER